MKNLVIFSIVLFMAMSCTNQECKKQTSNTDEPREAEKQLSNTDEPKNSENCNIAAIMYASNHHDERLGDTLWPERIGEWEMIKKAKPHFEGHYQPKIPLWGYEPDNDPKVMEKWIDAAADYGVNIFIFDWFWFDKGPFMESPLTDGFLKAKNKDRMQFYIMWANHDVKRVFWNSYKYPGDNTKLWEGSVDSTEFKTIVDRMINKFFKQPNYFKIDEKPVFTFFMLQNLFEGFGGDTTKTKEALDYFRAETKKAGFPGIHYQLFVYGEFKQHESDVIDYLGINSLSQYGWYRFKETDYINFGEKSIEFRDQWDKYANVPYFPLVQVGWDDTPRFPGQPLENIVRFNKSPESFGAFLQEAKEYCYKNEDEPNLIIINAWNEWIEGSYLLPCRKYGFQYLKKVKEVAEDKYDPYN